MRYSTGYWCLRYLPPRSNSGARLRAGRLFPRKSVLAHFTPTTSSSFASSQLHFTSFQHRTSHPPLDSSSSTWPWYRHVQPQRRHAAHMALHHLDLGHIDLVSTTSDRHLQLTSSVQLTASEEALRSLHVVDSREGCSSRRTWMTPAAGFHLTIDLHLCSDLLMCRHDLADALAQTLFDASVCTHAVCILTTH